MKTCITCVDLAKRQERKLKRNKINGTLLGIMEKIKTEDFRSIYEYDAFCTNWELICIGQFCTKTTDTVLKRSNPL
jgi:hypothetical protein